MLDEFVCHRCGTTIKCKPIQVADAVARDLGIPDDCDLAVAHNIHVA